MIILVFRTIQNHFDINFFVKFDVKLIFFIKPAFIIIFLFLNIFLINKTKILSFIVLNHQFIIKESFSGL